MSLNISNLVETSTRVSLARESVLLRRQGLSAADLQELNRLYEEAEAGAGAGAEAEADADVSSKGDSFHRKERLSLWAARVAVIAIGVSSAVLAPNYPFLTSPGLVEDSFPSTAPFDSGAAANFLRMSGFIAKMLASPFVGRLSDRIGRRPCMLLCVGVSILTTSAKFFAQSSFWGFNAANFANGLFGVTLPVAMAYASEALTDPVARDCEIALMLGLSEFGVSAGGIATILFGDMFFEPLWFGAAVNAVALLFMYAFLQESNQQTADDVQQVTETLTTTTRGRSRKPTVLSQKDRRVLLNIFAGAWLDNIGTAGFYPLLLIPGLFDVYIADFVHDGKSPLLSFDAFRWIVVLVSAMILVGALCSKPIFAKIGVPGGSVFGNLVTTLGIVGGLYVLVIEPTKASLAGFIILYFGIVPFTVVSNMSTGPMVERTVPEARRGFYQGINYAIMSLCSAVFPWVLGILADETTLEAACWTAAGFSLAATLVNVLLLWVPFLQPPTQEQRRKSRLPSALMFSTRTISNPEKHNPPEPVREEEDEDDSGDSSFHLVTLEI